MNWDAVAAISGIVSFLAVVGSLLYLSMQVKMSNKFSQSQTRVEIRHMAQQELFQNIQYPEIWYAMYRNEVTEDDKLRLHIFLLSAMRFREFIWRQYNLGLLDEATFKFYSRAILQVLAGKRSRVWWETHQEYGFYPEFAKFVNELLASNQGLDPEKALQGW